MERTRIQTYEEWRKLWNGQGQQSFELAATLLFRLPEVIIPLKRKGSIFDEGDLDALADYFRALYLVMEVTMNEGDSELVDLSRRAVSLLLDRCPSIMHHSRLPRVEFRQSRGGFWDWSEYRRMPSRLLKYFAHTRSCSIKELERQVASQCAHTLAYSEEQRRRNGEVYTQPFSWPDFWREPHRTRLLRSLIIHQDARCLDELELPDLLDDFFGLLCDARDFLWSDRRVNYPRKAKLKWPLFGLDLSKIEDQVRKLGLILQKPWDQILSPLDHEKAIAIQA